MMNVYQRMWTLSVMAIAILRVASGYQGWDELLDGYCSTSNLAVDDAHSTCSTSCCCIDTCDHAQNKSGSLNAELWSHMPHCLQSEGKASVFSQLKSHSNETSYLHMECVSSFVWLGLHRYIPNVALTSYWMVTSCPPNVTKLALKEKCESLDNDIIDVAQWVPVISAETGLAYRNVYCARCNEVRPYIKFQTYIVGNSVTEVVKLLHKGFLDLELFINGEVDPSNTNLLFLPPHGHDVKQCAAYTIGSGACRYDNSSEKETLHDLCEHIEMPVKISLNSEDMNRTILAKNVACLQCVVGEVKDGTCYMLSPNVSEVRVRLNDGDNDDTDLVKLFETPDRELLDPEKSRCSIGTVYDEFTDSCRQLVCPTKMVRLDFKFCAPVFNEMVNVFFSVMLCIEPGNARASTTPWEDRLQASVDQYVQLKYDRSEFGYGVWRKRHNNRSVYVIAYVVFGNRTGPMTYMEARQNILDLIAHLRDMQMGLRVVSKNVYHMVNAEMTVVTNASHPQYEDTLDVVRRFTNPFQSRHEYNFSPLSMCLGILLNSSDVKELSSKLLLIRHRGYMADIERDGSQYRVCKSEYFQKDEASVQTKAVEDPGKTSEFTYLALACAGTATTTLILTFGFRFLRKVIRRQSNVEQ